MKQNPKRPTNVRQLNKGLPHKSTATSTATRTATGTATGTNTSTKTQFEETPTPAELKKESQSTGDSGKQRRCFLMAGGINGSEQIRKHRLNLSGS